MSLANHAQTCNPSTPTNPKVGKTKTFSKLPHEIMDDPRLKRIDLVLVAVLARYAMRKDWCFPSVPTLASNVRCSERSIQYSLARLIKAEWIKTVPDPNPTNRVIVLLWRVENCTPPVQNKMSDPVQSSADELDQGGEKKEGQGLSAPREGAKSRPGEKPKPPAPVYFQAKPVNPEVAATTPDDIRAAFRMLRTSSPQLEPGKASSTPPSPLSGLRPAASPTRP